MTDRLPIECLQASLAYIKGLVDSDVIRKPGDLSCCLAEAILALLPRVCVGVVIRRTRTRQSEAGPQGIPEASKDELHYTLLPEDLFSLMNSGLKMIAVGDNVTRTKVLGVTISDQADEVISDLMNRVQEELRRYADTRFLVQLERCPERIIDEELAELGYMYSLDLPDFGQILLLSTSTISHSVRGSLINHLSHAIKYHGAHQPRDGEVQKTLEPKDSSKPALLNSPSMWPKELLLALDKECIDTQDRVALDLKLISPLGKPVVSVLVDSVAAGEKEHFFQHVPRPSLTEFLTDLGNLLEEDLASEKWRSFLYPDPDLSRAIAGWLAAISGGGDLGRFRNDGDQAKEYLEHVRAEMLFKHRHIDRVYLYSVMPKLISYMGIRRLDVRRDRETRLTTLQNNLCKVKLPTGDGTIYAGGYCVFSAMTRRFKLWYSWKNGPPSRLFPQYYDPGWLEVEEVYFPYPHVIYFPFYENNQVEIVIQIVTGNYVMCRRPEKLQTFMTSIQPSLYSFRKLLTHSRLRKPAATPKALNLARSYLCGLWDWEKKTCNSERERVLMFISQSRDTFLLNELLGADAIVASVKTEEGLESIIQEMRGWDSSRYRAEIKEVANLITGTG